VRAHLIHIPAGVSFQFGAGLGSFLSDFHGCVVRKLWTRPLGAFEESVELTSAPVASVGGQGELKESQGDAHGVCLLRRAQVTLQFGVRDQLVTQPTGRAQEPALEQSVNGELVNAEHLCGLGRFVCEPRERLCFEFGFSGNSHINCCPFRI
jgi:hypothetical protein